jgi:hypothetical protein
MVPLDSTQQRRNCVWTTPARLLLIKVLLHAPPSLRACVLKPWACSYGCNVIRVFGRQPKHHCILKRHDRRVRLEPWGRAGHLSGLRPAPAPAPARERAAARAGWSCRRWRTSRGGRRTGRLTAARTCTRPKPSCRSTRRATRCAGYRVRAPYPIPPAAGQGVSAGSRPVCAAGSACACTPASAGGYPPRLGAHWKVCNVENVNLGLAPRVHYSCKSPTKYSAISSRAAVPLALTELGWLTVPGVTARAGGRHRGGLKRAALCGRHQICRAGRHRGARRVHQARHMSMKVVSRCRLKASLAVARQMAGSLCLPQMYRREAA